jgi:ABC-type nitrate/sulfonate/bicarbonate transport system permease component
VTATATARSLPRAGARDGQLARLRGTWPSVFGLVAYFVIWEVLIRATNTPAFVIPAP